MEPGPEGDWSYRDGTPSVIDELLSRLTRFRKIFVRYLQARGQSTPRSGCGPLGTLTLTAPEARCQPDGCADQVSAKYAFRRFGRFVPAALARQLLQKRGASDGAYPASLVSLSLP